MSVRKLAAMLKYGADSVGPNPPLEFLADILGLLLLTANVGLSIGTWIFKRPKRQNKD